MNWIEIDNILYGIIQRHDSTEAVIEEARKQFKWTQSQAEAAVKPLLKRHTMLKPVVEKPKTRSKRVTKPKK
jgi:hypothetical protein